MVNIPAPSTVSHTPLEAAVREGRVFRLTVDGNLNELDSTRYWVAEPKAIATIVRNRSIVVNSGPVFYRVWIDFTLDSDPFVTGLDEPLANLNRMTQPVRPGKFSFKEVRPEKVLSKSNRLSSVLVTETDFDTIYTMIPQNSQFLVEIGPGTNCSPETNFNIQYIIEEYDDGTLRI